MLRQCVVTALSSGGSGIPLLSRCGSRSALAWILREFRRYGAGQFLLLTDDASGAVQHAADEAIRLVPGEVRMNVLTVPAGAGDGGALLCAGEQLETRFLFCDGNVLFDCNLAELSADQNIRGGIVLNGLDMADAVIGAFNRSVLEVLRFGCSLSRDVLPKLQSAGALRGIPGTGWFCNLCDAAQLARAEQEAPRRLHRPALLLDRDGVLNVDHGFVGTRDRFEWIPGALETIRLATQSGWHVFVVTNQSGVARGFYDEVAVRVLLHWMAEQAHAAGGTIDDTRYCPYHEEAAVGRYRRPHHWRKPQPGMLLDLIGCWELDPARCVMVGDQQSDMQAAAAAGVAGYLFPGGNLLDFAGPLIAKRDGHVVAGEGLSAPG